MKLFGCNALVKISAALSIPTTSSTGECKTIRARRRLWIVLATSWFSISSMNCLLIVNGRPPRLTSARPSRSMSSRFPANRRPICDAVAGEPIVATARLDGICGAAIRQAVPPSEWPTSSCGGSYSAARCSAAATRSLTCDEKLVSAKSPSLSPSPVKSKRKTAIPQSASARVMFAAALMFFVQVKQCANSA